MNAPFPPVPPVSLWLDPQALGAATDLYQLSMIAGYWSANRQNEPAVFESFVRRLPEGRNYLIFAGLEQALSDLLALRFSPTHLAWLRELPTLKHLPTAFFDYLAELRFEGDVWAVAEGSVVFAGEPLVRVSAPLAQAQWVETLLLASLSYPTLVASKAARIVHAARGRPVYDFGLRRAHGVQAGMVATRAGFLAGIAGTSNVEAAFRMGIPAAGTMAHSWVQSFASESLAFEAFARTFPSGATLLIDTYDSVTGASSAALIPRVGSVRIDSGDLLMISREVRKALDAAGRSEVAIVASGDLEEGSIDRLLAAEAPIDAFGVGTELVTSPDAPTLPLVYKLVEVQGRGTAKTSPGKHSYPLAKQVYRARDDAGFFDYDTVTAAGQIAPGEPLLQAFALRGKLTRPLPSLLDVREHCCSQLASLPTGLKTLTPADPYRIQYSERLHAEYRLIEGPSFGPHPPARPDTD